MRKLLIILPALVLIAAACNKTTTPKATPTPATTSDQTQNENSTTSLTTAPSTPTPTLTPTSSNPSPTPTPIPVATPAPTLAKVSVAIASSGFEPAIVTIKKGTTVVFTNKDTEAHVPASDPHPTHTTYPGFDAGGPLKIDQTYAFAFDKVGSWGYHDHLNPSLRGKVIVTE